MQLVAILFYWNQLKRFTLHKLFKCSSRDRPMTDHWLILLTVAIVPFNPWGQFPQVRPINSRSPLKDEHAKWPTGWQGEGVWGGLGDERGGAE